MAGRHGTVSDIPYQRGLGRFLLDSITEAILTLLFFVVRFISWLIQWSVALVIFVLVMAGAGYYVYTYALDGGKHVTVPQVTDLPITEASFVVADRGLELASPPTRIPHKTVPKYHVISQRPEPGRVVRSGRKVYVTVSMGADFLNAPDIVNKTLEEARSSIESNNFRIGSVARVAHHSPRDTVIAQDPAAGRSLAAQGNINLLVSQGLEGQPAESQGALMPDIRGMNVNEVMERMAPFKVTLIPEQVDIPGAQQDVVLDQHPAPDAMIYPGDIVTYEVKASGNTELPDTRYKAEVRHVMPYDWYDKDVRVEIVDRRGNRQVAFSHLPQFDESARSKFVAGSAMTVPVNYIGEAMVEFYVNGQLVESYLLKEGNLPLSSGERN